MPRSRLLLKDTKLFPTICGTGVLCGKILVEGILTCHALRSIRLCFIWPEMEDDCFLIYVFYGCAPNKRREQRIGAWHAS